MEMRRHIHGMSHEYWIYYGPESGLRTLLEQAFWKSKLHIVVVVFFCPVKKRYSDELKKLIHEYDLHLRIYEIPHGRAHVLKARADAWKARMEGFESPLPTIEMFDQ